MSIRGRFILRYTGKGPAPDAHVARLRRVPGTKVLEEADRMLLVEGPQRDLEEATNALEGWVLSAEKTVPVPDPRKRVEGEPE